MSGRRFEVLRHGLLSSSAPPSACATSLGHLNGELKLVTLPGGVQRRPGPTFTMGSRSSPENMFLLHTWFTLPAPLGCVVAQPLIRLVQAFIPEG